MENAKEKQIRPLEKQHALEVMRIVKDSKYPITSAFIAINADLSSGSLKVAITLAVKLGLISRVGPLYCMPEKEALVASEFKERTKQLGRQRGFEKRLKAGSRLTLAMARQIETDSARVKRVLGKHGVINKSDLKTFLGFTKEYLSRCIDEIQGVGFVAKGGEICIFLDNQSKQLIAPTSLHKCFFPFIAVRPERETKFNYQNGAVHRTEV